MAAALCALAAALALVGAGCNDGSEAAEVTTARTAPVATAVASDARRPPARLDAARGAVEVEEGPFTDRVELTGLALAGGESPVVRGRIRNAVDVSELIVLELRADFYDGRGRYIGSGRQVFHDAHAGAGEPALPFAIRGEGLRGRAERALLSIPQLVNE